MNLRIALVLLAAGCAPALPLQAQLPLTPTPKTPTPPANLLTTPGLSPGAAFLFGLEEKFAKATAEGGGKAFASFFADDAVTLANGKAPVVGKAAIAAMANWPAKSYQLTWTPQGGALSPAGDMGYTWGHYEGHSRDQNGSPVVTSGRYFTVWKREPDGAWKVVLEASNEEAPASGACCRLP